MTFSFGSIANSYSPLHLHTRLLSIRTLPLQLFLHDNLDAQCTLMTEPALLDTLPGLQQQHIETYFSLSCIHSIVDVFMFKLPLCLCARCVRSCYGVSSAGCDNLVLLKSLPILQHQLARSHCFCSFALCEIK